MKRGPALRRGVRRCGLSAGRRLAVGGQLIRARLHAIELQGLTVRIHRNLVVAIAVFVPHLDVGVEGVVVVVAKFPGAVTRARGIF